MNESPYQVEQHSYSQHNFPHGAGPGWYGSNVNLLARKPIPPQDKYWKRFIDICRDVCGTGNRPSARLILRTGQPVVSDEDASLAAELFLEETSKVSRSKSIWGRSQKLSEAKTYSFATAALTRLVHEGGRPGAACALVRRGGTITLSKDPQKQVQQISDRHNLIKLAATLHRDGLIDYFATISPPERIAEAFAIAFRQKDIDIVRVLLERGASVDSLFQSLPGHFDELDPLMLNMLLRAPVAPSMTTRDRWLQSAVTQGKMNMATMLLRHSSGQGLDYGTILKRSLEELHIESYLTALKLMLSCENMHFSGLLQQISSSPDMSIADQMIAMEATLCAANTKEALSARHRQRTTFLFDHDASEALQICCAASGPIEIIRLLRDRRFNTSVLPTTLASAIKGCDLPLLHHLYPRNTPVMLPNNFSLLKFPKTADDALHEKLLQRLLELEVPGSYLDDELLYAIVKQNSIMIKALLKAGASVDSNGAKSLRMAIDSRNVRLLQVLLPRSSKPMRNAIFSSLESVEKLPRRLMMKLFIEQGLSRDVLHAALSVAVCACTVMRDEVLIDTLTAAGADYRLVGIASAHDLINQGDFHAISDLLERMSKHKEDPQFMGNFTSQLMDYLVKCPADHVKYAVRCEIFKNLMNSGATGDGALMAFEEFLDHTPVVDEELLRLFVSQFMLFRSPPHVVLVAKALYTIDIWILRRLIEKIELCDEVLSLALEHAAGSALDDDAGTAERVRCYLTKFESKSPLLDKALEFHARAYAEQHLPSDGWPLKTLAALISKGFTGSCLLTHALMAIAEGDNPEVLAMVLQSAREVCTKDMIDSVLMLAIQTKDGANLEIIKRLLDVGASETGINMALLMCTETDNLQLCNILIEKGADVNYQDGDPLISAMNHDRQHLIESLLTAKKANVITLARAWKLVVDADSTQLATKRASYCTILLQAGFVGVEVQDFLMKTISLVEPGYEMIDVIFDHSEAFKQSKIVLGNQNPAEGELPGSRATKQANPMAALGKAIETGNTFLCRRILSHLPEVFSMPYDLLDKAVAAGTAILALLLCHVLKEERQEVLDACLVHAATLAADSGTCAYLLCEGASCESRGHEAIVAATKRALLQVNSDRAALEVLLTNPLSQKALITAWNVVLEYLSADEAKVIPEFGQLRAIKVLQLLLSAGFQDLEAAANCLYVLCKYTRARTSKCETCILERSSAKEDCCPFQRTHTKLKLLLRSILNLGVSADENEGRCIIAAADHDQYEILEILLSNVTMVDIKLSQWFSVRSEQNIFFRNSSPSVERKQARMKTMESILQYGGAVLSLEHSLIAAVQESVENLEARETAELLIRCGVYDDSRTVLAFLTMELRQENESLLSLVLEREQSRAVRLKVAQGMVSSADLDDGSTSNLLLSALCGSSSDLTTLSIEDAQNLLRATVNSNKCETVALILSCVNDKAVLLPCAENSSFLTWLLRCQAELTEPFFSAVLACIGPEAICAIDENMENLSLVQEAVLGGRLQLIPLLVSFGATSMRGEESMLLYTLQNTEGEDPLVIEAIRSLCNESTWDDGSLHFAATSMRQRIVNALLEHGHDPNFGIPFEESTEDYKLPLNLLCATASVEADESDCGFAFRNIVNNLIIHGADISAEMCGRSPLFNAFDNPQCNDALIRILVDCLRFSEDLERSLAEAETGNDSDTSLDQDYRRDSGAYVDVRAEQEHQAKDAATSAGPRLAKTSATRRYQSRFICPIRGCKITRQKISSLRRHYVKMHPDPKPHFRAKDVKRVKWVADEAKENTAGKTKAKGGHFVEDVEAVRTSFFEYADGKHHYSATMYVELDVRGPAHFPETKFTPPHKAAILAYLRSQDLTDLYYALEGEQPEGAVGVPIELLLGSTECAVCGDVAMDIENVFGNLSETCTHNWTTIMCKECLDGYMTSKITVNHGAVNGKVGCWAEGCKSILSHAEIQLHSDPALFEAYDFALLQQTIHEGETFAECSTAGCKGGGWLESPDVSYFECQWCGQDTCVSHSGPLSDHAGKPCPATPEGQRYAEEEAREEAERQAAEARTKAEQEEKRKAQAEANRLAQERRAGLQATETLMRQISKNCPKCAVPIEKRDGCDHMTCRTTSGRAGCGTEFCFQCLTLYVDIRRDGNGAHQPTCPHYRRHTYLH